MTNKIMKKLFSHPFIIACLTVLLSVIITFTGRTFFTKIFIPDKVSFDSQVTTILMALTLVCFFGFIIIKVIKHAYPKIKQ